MPAVCQCKAGAVGGRLESCNSSLTDPGLWSATPALPLQDPTPPLTQPLTAVQLPGELVQGTHQLKTNSIKKKKKKVANFQPVHVPERVPNAILTGTRRRRKDAGKVGGPILTSLRCCGNSDTTIF